ncbi:hypothetical protein N7517_009972 [Penicillium concentricum]|uniref:Uncharacterized protein n=1 Tax=Penicillium concentricum TaxID=293559 RepID=A0A9W9RIK2_9EURO|nr:uncharacterized protein N7517_009972 [Penicillium concentricum]KAJ5360781.1 hypothetical protein N7517_009972 [Penicillium concentricum]
MALVVHDNNETSVEWNIECKIQDNTYGLWDLLPAEGSKNSFHLAAKCPDGTYTFVDILENRRNFQQATPDTISKNWASAIFISTEAVV